MRLFLGIVLALAAVIGAWLLTMETPPAELATVEETAQESATEMVEGQQLDEATVEQQVNATAAVEAKTATEPSALEQALTRYPSVSVQDIQAIFSEDPALIGLRPDFMLALMERGDIAPNEVVMSDPRMGPLTATMFVVANARGSFTTEHFDRLLEMGADINGSETWRTVMAMETNPQVLDKWYAHASLGPETHEELYNKALGFGNLELRDYLLNEKGGAMADLQVEPMGRAMAKGMVQGTAEMLDDIEKQVTANTDVNSEVARFEVVHFLKLRARQAQMLKALTDDEKERQELDDFEQQLVDKIQDFEKGSH